MNKYWEMDRKEKAAKFAVTPSAAVLETLTKHWWPVLNIYSAAWKFVNPYINMAQKLHKIFI